MSSIVQRWNERYFEGDLSPTVLELLAPLEDQHPDVQQFVDWECQAMQEVGIGARDFSWLLAWELSHILPKIHPHAWDGMVPPITLKDRHRKLDDYLRANQWYQPESGAKLVDLGCGFPPHTTVDTAQAFPQCRIVGADPSFGQYLLVDRLGDYAVFEDEDKVRYFQAGIVDTARWESLTQDPEATKSRFRSLLGSILADRPEARGTSLLNVEADGVRLTANPILEYAGDNLRFMQVGLDDLELDGPADLIRCMNVLIYFDHATRLRALRRAHELLREGGLFLAGMNWALSIYCRYTTHQKTDGGMVPREFAFGVENTRPLELVSWYRLYPDDQNCRALIECVRLLRRDPAFMAELDPAMDALQERNSFCPRGEDGYLTGVDPDTPSEHLQNGFRDMVEELDAMGLPERAAASLRRAGLNAWRNPVGHVAVDPAGLEAFINAPS
jgi:SAM-dependent methyltransferase